MKKSEIQSQTLEDVIGAWVPKPFLNWKMTIQKVKAYAGCETPIRYVDTELLAKKRRINHSLFTMCKESRKKQELKCYQVIASLYSFPVQTAHPTRQTWISCSIF